MEAIKFQIISAMIVENDKTLIVVKIRIGSGLLKASVRCSSKNPFFTIHKIHENKTGISWKLLQRFNEIPESEIIEKVFDFMVERDRIKNYYVSHYKTRKVGLNKPTS